MKKSDVLELLQEMPEELDVEKLIYTLYLKRKLEIAVESQGVCKNGADRDGDRVVLIGVGEDTERRTHDDGRRHEHGIDGAASQGCHRAGCGLRA